MSLFTLGISFQLSYIANTSHLLLLNQLGSFRISSRDWPSNYLRDDPNARLILHMHGSGGTVGSGYRVSNYRTLSAGQPRKIYVLTFDYRGFGRSTGAPSESGLITDALAVVDWAINVAGIPPCRILIFAQSMGTAVSIAVSQHLALQSLPVVFAGTVLVAPFADMATLVASYRVAGIVPIWSPLARIPLLFNYLRQNLIWDIWPSKDGIARYVRANEANGERYSITIIHSEGDYDIPWHHTPVIFWHAVNASVSAGISYEDLELIKQKTKADLGAAGSVMEWSTHNGVIREGILKTGRHDLIMSYQVITMPIMRSFGSLDPSFVCLLQHIGNQSGLSQIYVYKLKYNKIQVQRPGDSIQSFQSAKPKVIHSSALRVSFNEGTGLALLIRSCCF
ncbi:hypothetical protein V490_09001 [Pseudogymnoascus sp. VKM F-3557]|nr:hypothetical protein V490_09001 [Pseudogymnoascus sp. VKM F-3557]